MNGYEKLPKEPPLYQYGQQQQQKPKKNNDAKSCMRFILLLLVLAGVAALGVSLYATFKPVGLDEGPLFVADPPPLIAKKKTVLLPQLPKKMGVTPRSTVLTASSTVFTLQYPHDLSDHVGQTYIVYNNATLPHSVVFTADANRYAFPHCPETAHPTWDDSGLYPVARFIDGQQGALIHWHVAACGRIAVIEQRHVEYCNHNLTLCVLPSVASANITELFSSSVLTDQLTAAHGSIGNLSSLDLTALRAVLVNLTASSVNATELHSVLAHIVTLITQTFSATTATITNLFAATGQIDNLSSTLFVTLNGTMTNLASVTANIQNLFANSGVIGILNSVTGTITTLTSTTFSSVSGSIVNLTSLFATIENLNVTGTLVISNTGKTIVQVGPTRTYKTISEALKVYNRLTPGKVDIEVDPGEYVDCVEAGEHASSKMAFRFQGFSDLALGGATIKGDMRTGVGVTYTDGFPIEHYAFSDYLVTITNGATVTSFPAVAAAFSNRRKVTAAAGAQIVNDTVVPEIDGCSASFSGFVPGNIAIVPRTGVCTEFAQVKNAIANGASAVIVHQTSAAAPIALTNPNSDDVNVVMISLANANILKAAILANASSIVSITPIYVDLVHPAGNFSQLQVNVAGNQDPNFNSPSFIGIVQGDTVVVTTAAGPVRRVVESASGNTITFSTPLTSDASGLYSSITFLPNRRIYPCVASPSRPVVSVFSGNVLSMQGFTIATNTSIIFLTNAIFGGALSCPNCVFDASPLFATTTPLYTIADMSISGTRYLQTNTASGIVSFINVRLDVFNSDVTSAFIYSTWNRGSALGFPTGARFFSTRLHMTYGNQANSAASSSILVSFSTMNIGRIWLARHGGNSPAIAVNGGFMDASRITVVSPSAGSTSGVSGLRQAVINCDEIYIEDVPNGIIVGQDASFQNSQGVFLKSIATREFTKFGTSRLSLEQYRNNEFGIRTVSLSNSPIDHAFKTHGLSNGPLSLTMDLASTFGSLTLYPGKYFDLINLDGTAHTLKLTNLGAEFEGPGIGAGNNTLTFAPVAGTVVSLFVRSTTRVSVLISSGAGFSFAAKRFIVARAMSEEEQHDSDMFAQFLEATAEKQDAFSQLAENT